MSQHIHNLGSIGLFTGAGAIAGAMGFGPVGAGVGALIGFVQSSTTVAVNSIAQGIFGKMDIFKHLAMIPVNLAATIGVTYALTTMIDIPMTVGAIFSLSATIGGIAIGILFGTALTAGLVGLVIYQFKPEVIQNALDKFKPPQTAVA